MILISRLNTETIVYSIQSVLYRRFVGKIYNSNIIKNSPVFINLMKIMIIQVNRFLLRKRVYEYLAYYVSEMSCGKDI